MKNHWIVFLILLVSVSCGDTGETVAEEPAYRIVESRDTIISIDPATYEETTQIVVTYDTLYVDPVDQ